MEKKSLLTTEELYARLEGWGPWCYAGLLLAAAVVSHFAVLSNDSFPLRWQAEHLSVRDPSTLYDAFFPIGYPLLLRVAGYIASPFLVMELMQIALSAIYFRKAVQLARAHISPAAALIAIPFLVFSPQILRAELSAVPDFLAALFVLLAFVELGGPEFGTGLRPVPQSGIDSQSYLRAGLWLGLGLLFRTHVDALVLAFVVALVLIERRGSFKKIGKLVLGVSPFVLFQGAIQIWSGHGFFETGQGFNIWKTMHGLDWSNPPAEFHLSLWQVIHFEPQKFVHTYGVLLLRQLYLLLPLSLFLMVAAVKRERFGSLTVLASATFLYILITLPGGSARAVTPVLPVIVLSVLVLFRRFIFGEAFAKSRNSVFIGLFTALVLIGVVGTFSGALRARHRIDAYGELQRATGLTKPENARGLYSDDYALYFPELRDATPRHSGGWAEIGLPNYLKTNPHISDSTSSAWYNALVQDHIAFAVLREPPIDHRVAEFVLSDTVHFLRVPFNGGFKVYRLK